MNQHLCIELDTLKAQYREDSQLLATTLQEYAVLSESGQRLVELLEKGALAVEQCFERVMHEMGTAVQMLQMNRENLKLARESLERRIVLRQKAESRLSLQVRRLDWMLEAYAGELGPRQGGLEELQRLYATLVSVLRAEAGQVGLGSGVGGVWGAPL